MLSKYSCSLYIGTLQVRHWSVAYYRWQFPIWRDRFKDPLTEYAKKIRISGKISIMERFSDLFASYEILMFIVHWYVTSKALVSCTLSLAVPNLEGKVQGPIDRVCKINSHIGENLHYGEVQ